MECDCCGQALPNQNEPQERRLKDLKIVMQTVWKNSTMSRRLLLAIDNYYKSLKEIK